MSEFEHTEPTIVPDEPAAVAETEDPPPTSVDLVEALGRIDQRLAESHRLIDRQADVAAKLHAENQLLREGELRKAQGALVLSVLSVFDDVSQMAATTEDPAGRNDLEIVAETLVDALSRNGVDVLATDPGEPFDARRHKIATVAPTSDPDADRTVAAVLRPGFAWADGELLRVADVSVHKYAEPAPEAGTDQPAAE